MITRRAYEEVVDFIAGGPSPGSLVNFQASDAAKQRVTELIEKEKGVSITREEKSELDHYMQLEHIMRLARARARRNLSSG